MEKKVQKGLGLALFLFLVLISPSLVWGRVKGIEDRGPLTKKTFIHYKRGFAKPPCAGGGGKGGAGGVRGAGVGPWHPPPSGDLHHRAIEHCLVGLGGEHRRGGSPRLRRRLVAVAAAERNMMSLAQGRTP